jgi:hypothetical protein
VSERDVRDGFGQGRLLSAHDALAAGMIDRIAMLDDVLVELQHTSAAAAPARRLAARTPERFQWESERELLNL